MCTQTHEAGGPGADSEAALFQQAQAGCSRYEASELA